MRRTGLLHAELNRVIAAMGHTDTLVIGDVGLPVPPGVPCIDLAVLPGTPSFAAVFDAIYAELAVERATLAHEIHGFNKALESLADRLRADGVGVDEVSHDDFKRLCARAAAVVRTGETSPYSNIILHAGVTF
ncbi:MULTISPECIES: D-ribose pyranase [unclassified Luteibacter]|uniref:D-ribose pyranase n=1 Tax=unclassified Luteibacter TaxID=2620188 RepID=UPI0008B793B6|nr:MULTISPECIES: D-ribose pyranase [unclassified Luteibacter]MDR6937513.1 D-ribose pyranase [Luteibacter sp. 3190]SEW23950.1 D-ribose pyranase [Luteibacter sp. 329MFSha]